MKALIAEAATLADYLARDIPCEPRVCTGCGRTFVRVTRAQGARLARGKHAACRRRRCHGHLSAATWTDSAPLVNSTTGDPS